MATGWYNTAAKEVADGTIDLAAHTLKLLLIDSSYTYDPDDDVVDTGGAGDIAGAEISVSGYTPGWGSASRKTVASKVFTADDANDRAEMDAADFTWANLGAGATIEGAVLVKEGGSDDTTSRPIAHFDLTATPTNGGDITLTVDAEGLLQFSTV